MRANSSVYFGPWRRPRLPGNFSVLQKSAQLFGPSFSRPPSYVSSVVQTMAPTPHSGTAAGMNLSLPPSADQSSCSNSPSSQPSSSSSASTCTTSRLELPPSTLARSTPTPPFQLSSTSLIPVFLENG